MERVTGIEPALEAWKASVLPLNHTRDWSGRQDSNLRHPAPKAGALPNCATSRRCTAASIIAEESKSAGKTLRGSSLCFLAKSFLPCGPALLVTSAPQSSSPNEIGGPYTAFNLTHQGQRNHSRIYTTPSHAKYHLTGYLGTLLVIALSHSIGMRLRTLFDNLILTGEREADTMRYPRPPSMPRAST